MFVRRAAQHRFHAPLPQAASALASAVAPSGQVTGELIVEGDVVFEGIATYSERFAILLEFADQFADGVRSL